MNDVSVRQAALLTCGVCGHAIGPRGNDRGHSKKDLMRCLYKANVGVVEVIQQNKWLVAEKKYGDLPREEPLSTEKIEKDGKFGGYIYTYTNGTVLTTNSSGDIIDVQRKSEKEKLSDTTVTEKPKKKRKKKVSGDDPTQQYLKELEEKKK